MLTGTEMGKGCQRRSRPPGGGGPRLWKRRGVLLAEVPPPRAQGELVRLEVALWERPLNARATGTPGAALLWAHRPLIPQGLVLSPWREAACSPKQVPCAKHVL